MQFPKRKLPKSFLAAALGPKPVLATALGPLALLSPSARPQLQPAVPQGAVPKLWEVASWEIAHLGSFLNTVLNYKPNILLN